MSLATTSTCPSSISRLHVGSAICLLLAMSSGCGVTGSDTSLTPLEDVPPGDEATEPCELIQAPEGEFIAQDITTFALRPQCHSVHHATAGSKGSTLRIQLDAWNSPSNGSLVITDLLGNALAELEDANEGSWIQLPLDRSGEYFVELVPDDPEAPAHDYALSAKCVADCAEYTRYPIVFLHGMAGTDTFVGVMDYWYGVGPLLTQMGYLLRMPPGGALAEPAQRAAEFSAAIDEMELDGIGRRFNLIAHSQGGVDGRYMIGAMDQGHRIASLTTVASPHHGSPFADIAAGTVFSVPGLNHLIDEALTQFTEFLDLGPGELAEATHAVTTAAMADFNESVPDSPDTAYFSWSGRTCGYAELSCQDANNGEIVDPMFWASYRLIDALAGENDGLVPVESAKWGTHLGILSADHLDEIGLLFGESGTFDHESFYLAEARRLSAAGF